MGPTVNFAECFQDVRSETCSCSPSEQSYLFVFRATSYISNRRKQQLISVVPGYVIKL